MIMNSAMPSRVLSVSSARTSVTGNPADGSLDHDAFDVENLQLKTEYEAGNGRLDIILMPKRDGIVPMIFELKKV